VSSDRWEKLQEIFIAALQREPGERIAFAREVCRGDASPQTEWSRCSFPITKSRAF
jgi:hypothetical protein